MELSSRGRRRIKLSQPTAEQSNDHSRSLTHGNGQKRPNRPLPPTNRQSRREENGQVGPESFVAGRPGDQVGGQVKSVEAGPERLSSLSVGEKTEGVVTVKRIR